MANEKPAATLWNRNFTILWAGLVQSYLGDAFLAIGLMWLVLDITKSPASAATVVALGGLPKLLGPLAGVLVDRTSKRLLMVGADLARGAILLGVFGLHTLGWLQVVHLYAVALALGLLSIVYSPSLRVLLPTLVPNERLPAANSALQAGLQLSSIVGASLAGVVLAAVGAPVALLIDGVTFLVAGAAISLIRFPESLLASKGLRARQVLAALWEGLRYIVGVREVLALTFLAFFINLVLSPINVILPVFSEKVLGAGVQGFGFLASAIGLGLLLGNVLAGLIGDRLAYAWMIFWGLLGMAASLAGLSLVQGLNWALAAVAILGATAPIVQVPLVTRLQRSVPQGLQGRVFATWDAVVTLSIPMAAVLAGRALAQFPVSLVFVFGAVGTMAVAMAWLATALRSATPWPRPAPSAAFAAETELPPEAGA